MSDNSSLSSAPSLPPDPHSALPPSLFHALTCLSHPPTPCTSALHPLPYPYLQVQGLSNPLTFPLLPFQAHALIPLATPAPHGHGLTTRIDPTVRNCLQIQPQKLNFRNPAWAPAIRHLVALAAERLGVDANHVKAELHKMLLYAKGGHFKPHRDTEKMPGMFATMVVQLPSEFEGGELVLRHGGAETVVKSGSDDGSCAYNTYCTAFYADVEHEVRPVTKGWRLVLVYNLAWVGVGGPPLVDEGGLADVMEELMDYVEEEKDELGRWSLAFGLEHRYTEASLTHLGVHALKGHDRLLVEALRAAATESEGVGELDVKLCMLSRTDSIAMDDEGEDVIETDKGNVIVDKAFAEDGSVFEGSLEFVRWNQVTERAFFEVTHESDVEFTGNEGATKETTYSTLAVVLSPKSCAIALSYTPTRDLTNLIQSAPEDEVDKRVDILLKCREVAGIDQGAWAQLQTILRFCAAKKLCKQACRAIQLASKIASTPQIDVMLSMVVRELGWNKVENAMTMYFAPADIASVPSMEHRLQCIVNMKALIPPSLVQRALAKIIEHIKRRGSFEVAPAASLNSNASKQHLWATLLRVVISSPVNAWADDQGAAFRVRDIEDLVPQLCEADLQALGGVWPSLPLQRESIKSLQMKVNERWQTVLRQRFIEETDLIATTKKAPRCTMLGGYPLEAPTIDWKPYLVLVNKMVSAPPVQQEMSQQFQIFLRVIPRLPTLDFNELKSAINTLVEYPGTAPMLQVQQTCQDIDRARKIADLQSRVSHLTSLTATAPPEAQVRYAHTRTGHAKVDAFFSGSGTQLCVQEFVSVSGARKLLRQIEPHLPARTRAVAGGTGRGAYLELLKPNHGAQQRRRLFERQREELGRLKAEMGRLEGEMRRRRLECMGGERVWKVGRVEKEGGMSDGGGGGCG